MEVAARIGESRLLENLGAVKLTRTMLVAPDGQSAQLALPDPMWGISRLVMDQALLETARRAGAAVLQPARCERIDPGEHPTVHVRDLISNVVHSHGSSHVLVCDGKGDFPPTSDLGIKAHYTGIDARRNTIVLFGVNGHYVGIAGIENGRWNIAMSAPAARVRKFRGDFDAMFGAMLDENVALRRAFACARRAGRWFAAPLPRFGVEAHWPPGVIPLGNAAAALEPIGGEGIGLAMRSAELAASEMIEASRSARAVNVVRLRRKFATLWRIRSFSARVAGLAVSNPTFAKIAAPIIDQTPALKHLALHLTGKRSVATCD